MTEYGLPSSVRPTDCLQAPSRWLPSPEAIARGIAQVMQAGEDEACAAQLAALGVPAQELLVTLLSARVGLRAAEQGLAFFHHELRGRLPMPEALAPERQVWEAGTLPVWQEGLLVEPKYFSFFLDTPLAPYNPNHRRKWRAHELLHGLQGFYWHPQMTRFECYLGARLDELLPVVHWYGMDEAFRPRCPAHRGQQLYRTLCPTCEALARPYWAHDPRWVEERIPDAADWIARAWEHFDEEWAACVQELDTGQRHEVPRAQLNASSDALGYLYSHWPRLTAWSFGSWVEHFLLPGVDFFEEHDAWMQHIAHTAQDLVSGPCAPDAQTFARLRARRLLQDVGYRVFLCLEWFEDGTRLAQRAEDALLPLLEDAATLSHTLHTQEVEASRIGSSIQQLLATTQQVLQTHPQPPAELQQNLDALGILWPDLEEVTGLSHQTMAAASQPQLAAGLESGAPQSWQKTPALQDAALHTAFVSSPAFLATGRLASRLHTWLQTRDNIDALGTSWVHFEAWLQAEPRRDQEAEVFAAIPEDLETLLETPGTLRLHKTLRRASWPPALLADVLGTTLEDDTTLAAIHHEGEQSLLLVEPEMAYIFDAIEANTPRNKWLLPELYEVLEALLENAFVIWLPQPRRS